MSEVEAHVSREVETRHGRFHDLEEILERLEHEYYDGRDLGVRIRWGRATYPKKPRREMRLAAYWARSGTITVNPALDRHWVPRYFIEHVVFHELLHHVFDRGHGGLPYAGSGAHNRHELHPPEFLEAEARYHNHARARAWEQKHLPRLLRTGVRRHA